MTTRAKSSALLVTLALCVALLSALPALAQSAPAPAPAANPPAEQIRPIQPESTTPAASPDAAPTTQGAPTTTGKAEEKPKSIFDQYGIIVLIAAAFLLFFWLGRKPRKEEKKRKDMLGNIKKGDKVTTIGGIVGTVTDVRDDELIVKVDEATNARMHFARWAIRTIGEDKPAEKTEEKK